MRFVAVLLSVVISGCATFESADHVKPGSPRFFAGTRLDMAALSQDETAIEHFKAYEMKAPSHPAADLLPSFAADVIMLPVALGYTATEPLLYLP